MHRAIAEAWRRLEDHILRRSAAATVWTGSVPPVATGLAGCLERRAGCVRATAKTPCSSTWSRRS